jgi:hypothetical protein
MLDTYQAIVCNTLVSFMVNRLPLNKKITYHILLSISHTTTLLLVYFTPFVVFNDTKKKHSLPFSHLWFAVKQHQNYVGNTALIQIGKYIVLD